MHPGWPNSNCPAPGAEPKPEVQAPHLPPRKAPASPLPRLSGNPPAGTDTCLRSTLDALSLFFFLQRTRVEALMCQALGHVFPLPSPFSPRRLFAGQVDAVILIY